MATNRRGRQSQGLNSAVCPLPATHRPPNGRVEAAAGRGRGGLLEHGRGRCGGEGRGGGHGAGGRALGAGLGVQALHLGDVGFQLADAVGAGGVGGEKAHAAAAVGARHLVPQADAGARVVGAARGHFQADQVGLGFVVAAVFEREQLGAEVGADLAQIAQPQHGREHRQADAGGLGLGQALARVFAQGVGHFVAHDGGDFVVAELKLVEDAGVEGDLAAGHAPGVDLLAADQVDLPAPALGARVPGRAVRDEAAGDGAQAPQLRVPFGRQRALGAGLGQHFGVLLLAGLLQRLGGHQAAHARGAAHVHLRQRGCGGGAGGGQQKGAARLPGAARSARLAGRRGGAGGKGLGVTDPAHGGVTRVFVRLNEGGASARGSAPELDNGRDEARHHTAGRAVVQAA